MDDITEADILRATAESAERDTATAHRIKARKNSINREHYEHGKKLADLQKLRQQAARLARKAGAKGTKASQFEGFTKNQIQRVIREAHHIINTRSTP